MSLPGCMGIRGTCQPSTRAGRHVRAPGGGNSMLTQGAVGKEGVVGWKGGQEPCRRVFAVTVCHHRIGHTDVTYASLCCEKELPEGTK